MFHDEDAFYTLSAQLDALNKKMDKYIASNMYVQNIICDYCRGEHSYSKSQVDNYLYLSFE